MTAQELKELRKRLTYFAVAGLPLTEDDLVLVLRLIDERRDETIFAQPYPQQNVTRP